MIMTYFSLSFRGSITLLPLLRGSSVCPLIIFTIKCLQFSFTKHPPLAFSSSKCSHLPPPPLFHPPYKALLVIFWLVFTIMGMHIFGGLPQPTMIWPNFDTFFNSLISTFNVSNAEGGDQG